MKAIVPRHSVLAGTMRPLLRQRWNHADATRGRPALFVVVGVFDVVSRYSMHLGDIGRSLEAYDVQVWIREQSYIVEVLAASPHTSR